MPHASTHHSIDRIPLQLTEVASGLRGTCQGVETEFLELGERLQQSYSEAEALTRLIVAVVEKIGGASGGGLLKEMKGPVHRTMESIDTYRDTISRNLSLVGTIVDRLGSLDLICTQIEKIGRFLKVVGVNMGVECARSPAEERMFGTVSAEIKEVSKNVLNVVASIREDAKSARNSQETVFCQSGDGLETLDRMSGQARRNVEEAMAGIDGLMNLFASTLAQAGNHSREISSRVGEIVVGIQFQDNMRQRAEHIADTLKEIGELLEADGEEIEPGGRRGQAYRLVRLQTAQLREIISEVSGVRQSSMDALEGIVREVENLEENLSGFGAQAVDTPVGRDPFRVLSASLGHLHDLLKRGQGLMARISRTAVQASDTAANLSGHATHVRDISMTTHILALNAIINANKLGKEGRTFDVLAQEVSGLSRQIRDCMNDATGLLDLITASVESLGSEEPEGEKEASVGDALNAGIDQIYAAYHRFQESAREAGCRSLEINKTLSETRSGLGFFYGLEMTLNGYMERLAAVSELLAPWKDEGAQLAGDRVEALMQQYTMEKERQILDQAFGVEGGSNPVVQGDDEVELFESFVDETESFATDEDTERFDSFTEKTAVPGNGDGTTGEAERFDIAPDPISISEDNGPVASEEKKENEDLGDNFELF